MFCHFSSGLYISVNNGHKLFIFCVIEEPIDTQFLIHVNLTSTAVDSFRENGRYGTNLLFLTRGERNAEGGGLGGGLAWLKRIECLERTVLADSSCKPFPITKFLI